MSSALIRIIREGGHWLTMLLLANWIPCRLTYDPSARQNR
jgi:hypothetical protein